MTEGRRDKESRVKKSLTNARVNVVFYFLTLVLSFFSRKIFLDTLGADFVGLTGTLTNLLGFLNLAELGIATAIGYLLYKPIFDADHEKISEIITVMGYLYRWIGMIILGAGIILSLFLPLIFPDSDTGFELPLIYFAYYSFLASSLIGYFINYRQNLLGADQKNYVVTASYQSVTIVKTIIQMVLAYYTGSYYLWVLIELTFGVVYSIVLNWKINMTYPWLKTDLKAGRRLFRKYPEVMQKTKQLFVHKIGSFVQFQTAPIIIYAFETLYVVALYQNYTTILTKVNHLINSLLSSTGASVGNLIAEGDKKRTMQVYWELMNLKTFIACTVCVLLYFLIDPFIALWIGKEYILGHPIVIVLISTAFISIFRTVNDDFVYGFGLFADVWAPLTEAAINITVAIVCGYYLGLLGVLLGGLSGLTIIIFLWRPYYLFSRGFKESPLMYWKGLAKILATAVPGVALCLLVDGPVKNHIDPSTNFVYWIIYACIIAAIYAATTYLIMSSTLTGMSSLNSRLKRLILRK